MSLFRLSDWPLTLRLESRSFGLFLACDARDLADETILRLARTSTKQGLAYLCAWGPDCERVHDMFDSYKVEVDPECERLIMTTWHDNETLEEGLWYFAHCAFAEEVFERNCQSWLAVSVRKPNWENRIRRTLTAYVRPRGQTSAVS